MQQPLEPVRVNLGERSYDIRFYDGDVAAMARDIAPFCPENALIVSQDGIWKAHGEHLNAALAEAGVRTSVHLMRDGEKYKTLESVAKMYDQMIAERFGRK